MIDDMYKWYHNIKIQYYVKEFSCESKSRISKGDKATKPVQGSGAGTHRKTGTGQGEKPKEVEI